MSKNTFSVKFYARESKKNKSGQTRLEVSITMNQQRVFLNLPYQVDPKLFNSRKMPKEYEDYICAMRTRINGIIYEMLLHSEPLTAERIREYLRTGGYKSYTVGDMFEEYLKVLSNRVGESISLPVYRKYELVRDLYFEDNNPSDEVNAVNPNTIEAFKSKMLKRYKSATAAGYLTKLKTITTYAFNGGKLSQNPFRDTKITRENPTIDYLTESELEVLHKADFGNDSLRRVVDCFIFQAYSGLSYSDMVQLKKEDIRVNAEGLKYISKRRVKTGTEYTTVLFPKAVEILEKYNYSLPTISNQKMNVYLHVVENILGFKTRLHSHLARHTFLTMLLNSGVRLETVSRVAGHSSTKITQKFYARLEDRTVIEEVANAFR